MKILKRCIILFVVAALLYAPVYFTKQHAISKITDGHPENYLDVHADFVWFQHMPAWVVTVTYKDGKKHSTVVDAFSGSFVAG